MVYDLRLYYRSVFSTHLLKLVSD